MFGRQAVDEMIRRLVELGKAVSRQIKGVMYFDVGGRTTNPPFSKGNAFFAHIWRDKTRWLENRRSLWSFWSATHGIEGALEFRKPWFQGQGPVSPEKCSRHPIRQGDPAVRRALPGRTGPITEYDSGRKVV